MKDNSAILTIADVGYRVGETTILNNVSFTVSPGEFRLITGPSGCGKSTLLKIIASLLSPTSGKIFLRGRILQRSLLRRIASRYHTRYRRPRSSAIRCMTT